MPQKHEFGIWNTIADKREFMRGHMMDCFKSAEQFKKDLETAEKSSEIRNKAVEKFHKSRTMIAYIDGFIVSSNNDGRGHYEWLRDSQGMTKDEVNCIIRGYIKDYDIVLYMGENFSPVPNQMLGSNFLTMLTMHMSNGYPLGKYRVYNGVKVGNPGEVWEPINKIREILVM